MTENLKNNLYIGILLLSILSSFSFAYYKYIVKQDFVYFTEEESIPNGFDINTYLNK